MKKTGEDLTITPNLKMLQFVDNNNVTYGYNGTNGIPAAWDYEILTNNLPASTTVSNDKKSITFTGEADVNLDIYLKVIDSNGDVVPNLSSVQLRLYVRGNLTVVTADWNACVQAMFFL